MKHVDPERQAHFAVYNKVPRGREIRHLRRCRTCRAELAELRLTADIARSPIKLRPPPERVWIAITNTLGFVFSPAEVKPYPVRRSPYPAGPTRRRPHELVVVLAAVTGVILGSMCTVFVDQVFDRNPTEAYAARSSRTTLLAPVGGHRETGLARLIEIDSGSRLRVVLDGPTAIDGYYEVWLIHEDGVRMVPLGILVAGEGTFGVPSGSFLDGYRTVDVSDEPNDGDPRHSRRSVVRGVLSP